jgi:hypothetical protein
MMPDDETWYTIIQKRKKQMRYTRMLDMARRQLVNRQREYAARVIQVGTWAHDGCAGEEVWQMVTQLSSRQSLGASLLASSHALCSWQWSIYLAGS